MPKKLRALSAKELKEIDGRRALARTRARLLVESSTGDEAAALVVGAQADPDNPPISDAQWGKMRPAHEVRPRLVARQLRRSANPIKAALRKAANRFPSVS
jgi:hypothetical protein